MVATGRLTLREVFHSGKPGVGGDLAEPAPHLYSSVLRVGQGRVGSARRCVPREPVAPGIGSMGGRNPAISCPLTTCRFRGGVTRMGSTSARWAIAAVMPGSVRVEIIASSKRSIRLTEGA